MQDISGYGLVARVMASVTFPNGFEITQYADDTDPLDIPEIVVADKKMGLNGDLIVWGVATPIEIAVAVVPGSDDDVNLAILLEANRTAKGKPPVRDIITFTGIYPQAANLTLSPGRILSGPPGSSVAAVGRLKSKVYKFTFENRTGSPA